MGVDCARGPWVVSPASALAWGHTLVLVLVLVVTPGGR